MRSLCGSVLIAVSVCLITTLSLAGDKPEKKIPSAPVSQQEYRLGPDDVIDVFVWKEPDLTRTLTVRPDGKISMPLINEMQASGKTVSELQSDIKEKLSGFVTDPVVTVMVKEFNSFKFSVLGEVKTPGVYKVSQPVTVLDAIAMAGGFTEFAKRDQVTVIRNNTSADRTTINLKKYLKDGKSAAFYLQPADVVYVK